MPRKFFLHAGTESEIAGFMPKLNRLQIFSLALKSCRANAGNATVPVNAPIQPPQAFVDAMAATFLEGLRDMDLVAVNLASKAITAVQEGWLDNLYAVVNRAVLSQGGSAEIALNGNALSAAQINLILGRAVFAKQELSSATNWTLDLSGGTNAAPTGQGITDKAELITAGWIVLTN